MQKQKKRVKQLLRYILPTMIILVAFMVVSQITLLLTKREAKENSTKISQYFVRNIEDSLSNLQLFTYELLTSAQAENLQRVKPEYASDLRTRAIANELGNELYNSCLIYDLMADAVVYYPELDLTVSRKSCLTSFQYLHLDDHDLVEGSEEHKRLYQLFFEHTSNEFVVYSDPDSGRTEMFFVRTLSSSDKNNDRILVLRLNTEEIGTLMADILQSSNLQYIAMVTESGSICASAGAVQGETFTMVDKLEDALDSHVYIRIHSSVWNADFCFVQSDSVAYRFANTLFTISLMAIILGAALSLFLAINVYRNNSLREQTLLQNLPFDIQETEDLFSAINAKLNHMYEENIDLIEQMEQQSCMVGNAFLKELLHMQGASHVEIEHLCAIYDISLENDCFALFFSIPKTNTVVRPKDEILSVVRDAGRENFSVFWTKFERVDVFLCNYDSNIPDFSIAEFRRMLEERLSQHRIYQLPQILFSAADIPDYFRSQYVQIIRSGRPMSVKKLVDEEQICIRQFLEAVQQFQLQDACALLPALSEAITSLSRTKEGTCQMFALLGSLYRLPIMQEYTSELNYMFEDTSGKSWTARLAYILRHASHHTNADTVQQSAVEQAHAIILKEYDNVQLSLSLLAERLGVSQSYLSRAFKQRYKENVLHFLNRVRVDHAKEYLLQSNDSINTIALKVGFLSDMNLIRVFKKLEDETPGSFRKRQNT